MKNVLIFLLTGMIILITASCTTVGNKRDQNNEEDAAKAQNNATPGQQPIYNDGTYDGKGDQWEYGNEDATIVINDDIIKSIALRRLDRDGKEVNYNNWTGQEVDGKLYPNLKQFRIDLADDMLEKQTYDVDAISGATVSSENWKIAVKRALEKAEKQ